MLSDYRTWLESELKLLGNASHHAYSFGQANMAKRAIEQLDRETDGGVFVKLSLAEAAGISTALEMLVEQTSALPPELALFRDRLNEAVSAVHPHDHIAHYELPNEPAPDAVGSALREAQGDGAD
jgi:predicted component of type VI protein secretion system